MYSKTILAALVCAAVLSAVALATPLPQQGLFGGGSGRAGNVGFNHNFNDRRNSQIGGGANWQPGFSSANIHGQRDVWNSKDGRSRVYAGGDYSRVLSGPAKGMDQLNGRVGAQTDVWRSRDGNIRVFTGAERNQGLKGPGAGRGETSINAGIQGKF